MSASSAQRALFGRDREIAELGDAVERVTRGEPRLALVSGDAGIGKTSVVSELTRRAADMGFAIAVGHCLDIEAAMSFAPAVEAVRTLVAADIAIEEHPQARRMKALLDPGTPENDSIRMLDDLRLTFL